MTVLLDGIKALGSHAFTLAGILLIMIWGEFIVYWLLEKIFDNRISDSEYFSLSAVGWVIPVSFWVVFLFLGRILFGEIAGRVLALILIPIPFIIGFKRIKRISLSSLGLAALFIIFLILNFAFLERAVFPSYFDSAEHYRLITDILKSNQFVPSNSGNYYHLGYHFIAAAFVYFFNLPLLDVMLVFGQVLLSALPLSLFFIIKQETNSVTVGLFTVLIAGLGWHMPFHVLNWGKYPALLGLVCIHFVLGLLYLSYRNRIANFKIYLLFAAAIAFSTLIHSRTLIVYLLLLVAFLITNLVKRLPAFRILFILAVGILIVEIYFIWQSDVLRTLVNSYVQNDIWMLAALFLLLIFAIRSYSKAAFLMLIWLDLILLSLFVPIELSSYGKLTLLDRPFVQMLAYLPLTIIAGLGFSGLLKFIERFFPSRSLPAYLTVFISLGLVILNASLNREFYPSNCCQLVSRDDLAAFAWMDENLPPDANILIASSSLYVTSFETANTRSGIDGGIWITPLISRKTTLAWNGLAFDSAETHLQICAQNLSHLYVGGTPQSFNAAQLDSFPDRYQPVFLLPTAKVYRITGCD